VCSIRSWQSARRHRREIDRNGSAKHAPQNPEQARISIQACMKGCITSNLRQGTAQLPVDRQLNACSIHDARFMDMRCFQIGGQKS
jgi:hypothetical protein